MDDEYIHMQSHFKLRNIYFLLDKNQDEFVGNIDVVHLNINYLEYTKSIYIYFFHSVVDHVSLLKQYVYCLRLNKWQATLPHQSHMAFKKLQSL